MNRATLFLLIALCVDLRIHAQCGQVQSLNATQISQLSTIDGNFRNALYAKNLQAIDSLSEAAKTILGSEAGKPETPDTYNPLSSNTAWINAAQAVNLSRLLIAQDSLVYTQSWRLCKGQLPPSYQPNSVPLRTGAEVCIGLIRIAHAETDLARRALYLQWATGGLDSLLTMQLANGAFPFPDLRMYGDPVFTPIINNYLQSLGADSVNVLQNGWIIDDSGTGEFKFDAGVIGGAFAEAFMFTGDTNYRNAALKVAAYMDTLRMNTNYNYNTFQTYGLAFGYALDNSQTDWISHADTINRYSVLPGQIPNGRWMDGHNARSTYHSIIIHNTSAMLLYANGSLPWEDTTAQMLCAALRNFITYYSNCDASVGFDGLLRAWKLDATIVPVTLHDSITDLIGNYINQANINGRYLDVYTMGLYMDAQLDLSSTGNIDLNPMVVAYPNPGTTLMLEFGNNFSGEVAITITDVNGAVVQSLHAHVNSTTSIPVPVENLSAGIYFLNVESIYIRRTVKWIKL